MTAASSAGISDGAAAAGAGARIPAPRRAALKPLARILGYASFAREPEWFTLAPVGAIREIAGQARMEGGGRRSLRSERGVCGGRHGGHPDLGLDPAKVNVNGGACALGHPIGATGARILTTLIHALEARGGKRGIASLCIGGGEATAIAVQLP